MFGYVVPAWEGLSEAERERYHEAYCGLCRAIGERCGQRCRCALTYDLVFLDPPYALPASCALGVPRALAERGALAADAIVVYEHAASTCADADEAVDASGLALARRKKYGDTVVDVLRPAAPDDAD